MEELKAQLRKMRWKAAAANLDIRTQQALAERLSPTQFLELLVEDEKAWRQSRRYTIRLRLSHLNPMMSLENYDFSFHTSINKREIFDFATGQFIDAHQSIIFVGKPGLGKTHLANAIGLEVLKKERTVRMISMPDLVTSMSISQEEGPTSFRRMLKGLLKPDLLIVDEIGYKTIPRAIWGGFFELISKRNERQSSLIVTTNRDFAKWGELFTDESSNDNTADLPLASAIIDRILHNAKIIRAQGESYRTKDFRRLPLPDSIAKPDP